MEDFIAQRDLLITKLGDEAKNYDCVHMMTAAYDPPFKVNEYYLYLVFFVLIKWVSH